MIQQVNSRFIRDNVARAITALGDLNTALILTSVVPGVYDPVTGLTADVTSVIPFSAPVVRPDQADQADFPGVKNVEVILAPYNSMQGHVPDTTDFITAAGVRWEILRVRRIPSDAIYKIWVVQP